MTAPGGTGAGGGEPRDGAGEAYAVELHGITKRFPGVVANKDIELRVRRGEVHAIVGENGAGKSTLMKTLYGEHRPDEGEILVDGRTVSFKSPSDAIEAGIGMVHQHFMLADNFTVLENVILGSEPNRGIRLDRAEARRRITEISLIRRLAAAKSMRPARLGSLPSTTFSSTVRLSASMKCWWTMPTPASMASLGEWKLTSRPSTAIVPSSGRCMP